MPQASKEVANKMYEMFGSYSSDEGPMYWLEKAGYKLTKDWTWKKEGISSYDQMTQEEYDCLVFLVQEWDFGGLELAEHSSTLVSTNTST